MPNTPPSIAAAIRNRVLAPRKARVWTQMILSISDRALRSTRFSTDSWPPGSCAASLAVFDIPGFNRLTGKATSPDPRAVIDALARKNNLRVIVDGITAANELGLTDAVPARITVFTDARLRPVKLGKLTIEFRHASPSRLYWAGRPAMRFVQELDWLRDMLPSDDGQLRRRLVSILGDPEHGQAGSESCYFRIHSRFWTVLMPIPSRSKLWLVTLKGKRNLRAHERCTSVSNDGLPGDPARIFGTKRCHGSADVNRRSLASHRIPALAQPRNHAPIAS
jgi:hypothetical protein